MPASERTRLIDKATWVKNPKLALMVPSDEEKGSRTKTMETNRPLRLEGSILKMQSDLGWKSRRDLTYILEEPLPPA